MLRWVPMLPFDSLTFSTSLTCLSPSCSCRSIVRLLPTLMSTRNLMISRWTTRHLIEVMDQILVLPTNHSQQRG